MANLLVTGGAGFIGSNFARYWRQSYPSDGLVVIDALTYAGNQANLQGIGDLAFIEGNICDGHLVERMLRDHKIDTIVHFAAETHVDRSIFDPDAFIQANIVGVHELLKAAKAVWLDSGSGLPHRFHHVSTDEVYGTLGPGDAAFNEANRYAPNSPYAASKAASDHLVRAYHQTFGLEISISNCSNNYGPYQFPEKLIPLFIINALHGEILPIYGDGLQIRDWLYVDDHCHAIELVLKMGQIGECYNIGGGEEMTNLAVIDTLCTLVDDAFAQNSDMVRRFSSAPAASGAPTASLKSFVADRPGHDRRYAIDERKIRSELGYEPKGAFKDNFRETLAWYIDNEDWWRKLIGKNGANKDAARFDREVR